MIDSCVYILGNNLMLSLFYCLNCFSFDHWVFFQVGSCIILTGSHPFFFFIELLCLLAPQDSPEPSGVSLHQFKIQTFLQGALDPLWKMVVETKRYVHCCWSFTDFRLFQQTCQEIHIFILTMYAHIVVSTFSFLRLSINMKMSSF